MKTNFILPIGIFAILTTIPNIANAIGIGGTGCIQGPGMTCECSGGSNAGATCTVNSQCPGGTCVNVGGGTTPPILCTPENCKPTTTGWGSCGSGANSYVECEATAECVNNLCVRGQNYRCVAGAYGNPSASNKTACTPCPSPGTSRPEPPGRTVLARINTHLIVITSKKRRGICPVSFILPLLYPLNHLGSWKYPPHVHAVHRVLVSKPHSPKRQHHRHYQISPYSSVRWGHNKHRPGPKRD